MSKYHYVHIKKKEIPVYLNKNEFWNQPVLPVSQQRLYAQYQNESADNDDLVLILAYNNDNLIGYIGAYPDSIYIQGEKRKIAWLSTWWSAPSEAGMGWILLKKISKSYEGKIGVSSFTMEAKKIYDISGYFEYFPTMNGLKAYMRLNSLPFSELSKTIKLVSSIAGALLNPFQSLRLSVAKKNIKVRLKNISVKYCNYVDDASMEFISSLQSNDLLKRDQDFFNTLKAYQWLVEAPVAELDKEASRYSFSAVSNSFNLYLVKVCNENDIIGFIVMSINNHELKVLYTYSKPEYLDTMADVIVLQTIATKATLLKSFENELNDKLKSYKGAWLFKRNIMRNFIVSKKFNIEDTTKYKLHTGDGDYCFT